MNLSRRGFIAGLLATTSVAAIGININPPVDLSGGFQAYTSHFKWNVETLTDWKYAVRVCNIDTEEIQYSGWEYDNTARLEKPVSEDIISILVKASA